MADLCCERVTKSYRGREVLSGVDMEVPTGTLTAILGASGSGKTTLLRAIMGFVAVDAGIVTVGGRTVADAGRVHVASDKRHIGYVAQEGALFPHLSVGENVAFGLPRAERRSGARAAETLVLVGLDDNYASRPAHELSGGEQRRVALARALAPRPQVVLLDEPFSGLDAALRAETREAVLHALHEEGATALLVTHDQAEALSMGREVAVLRDGRLVQKASPATVYRTPIDVDVARFLGEANVAPGVASDGHVDCPLGRLQVTGSRAAGRVEVLVRPEQVLMATLEEANPKTGQQIAAVVIDHTYYGADTVVRMRLQRPDGLIVKARTSDRNPPQVGEAVRLEVRGSVVVFPGRKGPS
jgi:iron(III) transport system ATP-binding protein